MNHNVFIKGFTVYRSNDTKYYDVDENRFLMVPNYGRSRFYYFVENNRADGYQIYRPHRSHTKSISQDDIDQMVLEKWKAQLAQQTE